MDKNNFTLSTSMIYIGDIFYRYDEGKDEPTIIRICKAKNTNKFIAETEDGNISVTRNELIENYSRLKNDAYITFFVLELDKGAKDVAVTIHRRKDLDKNDNVPYAICRQQFENSFNSTVIVDDLYHIGLSMSKDTCPNDMNYTDLYICNGIKQGVTISAYIGDTLDIILHFIKTDKYDEVLKEIDDNANKLVVEGTCKSLRELLEYHDIMYDFLLGFDIVRVPFKVEDNKLTLEQIQYLEHITKHVFIDALVVPKDTDINLDEIQKSHIKIYDENEKVYIIAYLKGEYINNYYKNNFKDKRDAVMMLKYRNKATKQK